MEKLWLAPHLRKFSQKDVVEGKDEADTLFKRKKSLTEPQKEISTLLNENTYFLKFQPKGRKRNEGRRHICMQIGSIVRIWEDKEGEKMGGRRGPLKLFKNPQNMAETQRRGRDGGSLCL